jgi:hypothetical protein
VHSYWANPDIDLTFKNAISERSYGRIAPARREKEAAWEAPHFDSSAGAERGQVQTCFRTRHIDHGVEARGGEARAFSTASMNSGSSGLVKLEKLAITLPWRSTTYL